MTFNDWPSEILFRVYKGVMWLKTQRKTGELDWYEKLWGYPFVVVGFALDVLYNLIFATIKYKDLPREWLFTSRLIRYKAGELDWRRFEAEWICVHLNEYDEGHC